MARGGILKLKDFDIKEYDYNQYNERGIDMVIEENRIEYREDYYNLTEEWEIYED